VRVARVRDHPGAVRRRAADRDRRRAGAGARTRNRARAGSAQRAVRGGRAARRDGALVRPGRRVSQCVGHRQHAELDHRVVRLRTARCHVTRGGHSLRRPARAQRPAGGLRRPRWPGGGGASTAR
jgi:hypothetical protein